MFTIYALIDPLTHDVRYVGMTGGTLRMRLQNHIGTGEGDRSAKAEWCRALMSRGLRPAIARLAVVDIDGVSVREVRRAAEKAEREWIARFESAGARLLNILGTTKKPFRKAA